MGKVLRAFWHGLRESPRAHFAPALSALASVRAVFEADASPRDKPRGNRTAAN